jgi:hypothetical protein
MWNLDQFRQTWSVSPRRAIATGVQQIWYEHAEVGPFTDLDEFLGLDPSYKEQIDAFGENWPEVVESLLVSYPDLGEIGGFMKSGENFLEIDADDEGPWIFAFARLIQSCMLFRTSSIAPVVERTILDSNARRITVLALSFCKSAPKPTYPVEIIKAMRPLGDYLGEMGEFERVWFASLASSAPAGVIDDLLAKLRNFMGAEFDAIYQRETNSPGSKSIRYIWN